MSKVYFNHTTKQRVVKLGMASPATIALKRDGDSFVFGVTICSKLDSYSKKTGREIAENRMNQEFYKTKIPDNLLKLGEEIGEKAMTLAFLYQLSASITMRGRKWKRRITKFNSQNKGAKIIPMTTPETAA